MGIPDSHTGAGEKREVEVSDERNHSLLHPLPPLCHLEQGVRGFRSKGGCKAERHKKVEKKGVVLMYFWYPNLL